MNALFIDLLGYFHTLLFVEIRKIVVFAALISHRNLYNFFFATGRFVVIDVANFSAEERQRGGYNYITFANPCMAREATTTAAV